MASLTIIVDLFVLVPFLVALAYIRDYRRRRGLPYPPGPPPLPLIGNLLHFPREFSWTTFSDLSKKHGASLFSYDSFVLLNSW